MCCCYYIRQLSIKFFIQISNCSYLSVGNATYKENQYDFTIAQLIIVQIVHGSCQVASWNIPYRVSVPSTWFSQLLEKSHGQRCVA